MQFDTLAVIIGAQKAGTTSLFEYLVQHPQICACQTKEPNFFSNDEVWQQGWDWYDSLWTFQPEHEIALEASVSYTKGQPNPLICQRMGQRQLKYKFIYIVRNPIERIESHYTHGYAEGWPVAAKPLAQGIDPFMIDTSRYAAHLDLFSAAFTPKSICVVEFDALRSQRVDVLRKIVAFLGLNWSAQLEADEMKHNPSVGKVRLNRLGKVVRQTYLRLGSVSRLLPAGLRRKVLHSLLGQKIEKNFTLHPDRGMRCMPYWQRTYCGCKQNMGSM